MPAFQYVSPTEVEKQQMQVFRDEFQALSDKIEKEIHRSRGRTMAITKLEEAAFWLNKAITHND